eukprot:9000570-Alexandrium_andersonii.AAC.1
MATPRGEADGARAPPSPAGAPSGRGAEGAGNGDPRARMREEAAPAPPGSPLLLLPRHWHLPRPPRSDRAAWAQQAGRA